MANLNRLKAVLAEQGKTNKWLAEQVGKDPATISKWCTNQSQPTLETLLKIAELLEMNYTELVRAEPCSMIMNTTMQMEKTYNNCRL